MSEHFIKNIEIKEYKLFNDFKADGFGRVNLIGGKNNVGKTAFMEALLFVSLNKEKNIKDFITVLLSIDIYRNYDFIYELHKANNNTYMKLILSSIKEIIDMKLKSNINDISINFNKELKITLNNKVYNTDDLNYIFIDTELNFTYNFVSSSYISSHQLTDLYDGVKLSRKRDKINEFIKLFDKDLIEYDVIDNMPVCFSSKLDSFINLDSYGNGLKRYIAYVCAIWANQNSYIFIDEIENGIHYTNFDKLWKIILTVSKNANCQVFATTHSKECIESYARVAKKLEDKEIAFIEMGINKYNKPRAIVMDSDRFFRELTTGNEVRGW